MKDICLAYKGSGEERGTAGPESPNNLRVSMWFVYQAQYNLTSTAAAAGTAQAAERQMQEE